VKHELRSLLRDKGFTGTVVLTLAVCIAANTTTFAVVNSVLLRPLPVADSQAIVLMSNQYPKAGVSDSRNSGSGDYYDRLAGVTALKEQAVFRMTMQTMDLNGSAEQVHGMIATPSLLLLRSAEPSRNRRVKSEKNRK
jgi:putative ABC transport system permease protein